jgi:hypothetical protein
MDIQAKFDFSPLKMHVIPLENWKKIWNPFEKNSEFNSKGPQQGEWVQIKIGIAIYTFSPFMYNAIAQAKK